MRASMLKKASSGPKSTPGMAHGDPHVPALLNQACDGPPAEETGAAEHGD